MCEVSPRRVTKTTEATGKYALKQSQLRYIGLISFDVVNSRKSLRKKQLVLGGIPCGLQLCVSLHEISAFLGNRFGRKEGHNCSHTLLKKYNFGNCLQNVYGTTHGMLG